MRLCGEFTASTMFTRGGTAMYERQPEGVMGIEERIAEVLRRELKGNVPLAEHVASVLVAELGLTEQWTWEWVLESAQDEASPIFDSRAEADSEAGDAGYCPAVRHVTPWTPA